MRSDEFCRGGNMTLLSLETEEEDKMINSHVQANPGLFNNIQFNRLTVKLDWNEMRWGIFRLFSILSTFWDFKSYFERTEDPRSCYIGKYKVRVHNFFK